MANYPPSTIGRIGDINRGLMVETGSLAKDYFAGLASTQTELFTLKGRILIRYLFLEILTDFGANAVQVAFNVTFTTPVIAKNALCIKCAALTSGVAGLRAWHIGGAVGTTMVITDSAGVSDIAVIPQMVGGKDFVGTLGMLATDATLASGTAQVVLCYVPMSEGAYAEALL